MRCSRFQTVIGRAVPVLAVSAVTAALLMSAACDRQSDANRHRMIVLGFDGMDYALTRELMAEGRLPNLSRLAKSGTFAPLETSIPPQSPVAWSTFITGLDPGSHGIFDFIHRDPQTMVPYLSTTRTAPAGTTLKLGKWQFPLSGGSIELLRQGRPFWDVLENRGIKTTIIRMPANFPPSGTATHELSGMGTPDIIGSYGTFSFYTSEPYAFAGRPIAGGTVYPVDVIDNVVKGTLYGPDNPFLRDPKKVSAEFTVYVDPSEPVAKLVAGGEERVLKVGEWSDWLPVEFGLIPSQKLRGVCRFYLKAVRPDFALYATPINMDPMAPAMPISTPASYAAELAGATGRFYTQGMPEDTKSLSSGVFSADEFLAQARMAGEENRRQYRHVVDRFDGGLLFYYFGNVDQISHMMWRPMDPGHPAYNAATDARYSGVVKDLYVGLDRIVGETIEKMGTNTTLVVMSDHGFTSWRRAFHLNSWLEKNGYLAVLDPAHRDADLFTNVDWSRTRAYGLGLNGLYINVKGRERDGIVAPADRERLSGEIAAKLLQAIDPTTNRAAITRVYRREQAYDEVRQAAVAPDIIVGYAKMTRGSNESALGKVPAEVIVDNTEAWSGDHCMDHEAVPGVLFTSRRLATPARSLETLAGALLAEFGVQGFPSQAPSGTSRAKN